MSQAGLAALLAWQAPDGGFPSCVGEGADSIEDRTCFVTASIALLLATMAPGTVAPDTIVPNTIAAETVPSSLDCRAARDRALDFVERCEAPDAPGAFGFYPFDGRGSRLVDQLPPDADDTALAWLALLAAGRRDAAAARAAFHDRIGPASCHLVPGDAPPWVRPGAVRTWLVECGRDNPVDLTVNANVAALAARIGAADHPAAEGACASLLAAASGGYEPVAFRRHLTPYYARIDELRLAVERAVALGAGALAPCLPWLEATGLAAASHAPDKPLYCNAHGSPVWRSPALQHARILASAYAGAVKTGEQAGSGGG
jgi:hypothetical protein